MAESKHHQIAEALKARFEAISGDGGATYWYTPDRVARCTVWDRLLADPTAGAVLYGIRAGRETHREESTGDAVSGGGLAAEAEFFVLMLRQTNAVDENPLGPDSGVKAREQDRMVRDFLRALWLDVTLGGLANNIADGSVEVDRDVDVEGWACVEARFTVLYSYFARTP
jgi:hypothetical protein